jgi:hypothetical protein
MHPAGQDEKEETLMIVGDPKHLSMLARGKQAIY